MILTLIFVGMVIFLMDKKSFLKLRMESIFAIMVLSVSVNLSFFVIFPVTFDRSVTTYLLSTLDSRGEENGYCSGLKNTELEDYFINEYVQEEKAIERRIIEQSVTDFVREKDDCVWLTFKGKNFLNFMAIIKKMFAIK